MQDRYTGDIGDFSKLGLLRQLASTGLSIGINWYRAPDETHNNDGLHIGYLQKEEFRSCDPALWAALGQIVSSGKREIAALERSGVLTVDCCSPPVSMAATPLFFPHCGKKM